MKTKLLIFAAISSLSLPCFAVSTNTGISSAGTITGIATNVNGFVTFAAGDHTGKPTCASTVHNAWALDVRTPGGKATLAVLSLASAQRKTINVYGTGTCSNIWGEREDVGGIEVKD